MEELPTITELREARDVLQPFMRAVPFGLAALGRFENAVRADERSNVLSIASAPPGRPQPPGATLVTIDGTDALAYVLLRPGADASGVVIEAGAKGISKKYAAYALRHTAQSWDPDDTVGADVGQQLKAALAEIERLRSCSTQGD